ncbi:50S ribosomal protein L11 methyltransferase [Aureisphaera galaxeae]|uniref:50S ribosomal protein L11 methyltransferase n=1 Tax=Aureisphaera galaxeae TaxID=1538023 RepID=UPI0023501E9D|nr:50S ribosomal protein L11 methyltransferase [Aureisphaera galaxeae]MDC8006152.1 50S ribosomal protein L11 methyltransferase [Aureisphaera galaxeae]
MAVYIEYDFKVSPLQPGTEILIAELGYAGFESFVENEEGVKAYIQKEEWNADLLEDIQILNSTEFEITHEHKEIEQVNWNAEWESNFKPIVVSEDCAVRAPFHEPYNVPYEIIIEPKMSFGTGHHETTYMVLQFILENDFEGKTVLDMGCGTAVLAILAEKRGAVRLDAIDIDEWCVENSTENCERNQCNAITVQLGDAALIPKEATYDTLIANINRNILLNDMPIYEAALKSSGELYLSGFYEEDLPMIKECCEGLGMRYQEHKQKNSWIAAKFVKS